MIGKLRIFGLFLIVGFLVFFNGLNGDFVHDDNLVLSHSFFGFPGKIFNFFGQAYFENFYQAGLYRPLAQFSFGLNFLAGSSPFGFHLVNILLHILNSFLVFLFLKKLTVNVHLSFIAALLFLVLPIHVEAITSIVGRAELLSFLFGISTILLWLASLDTARAHSVNLYLMGSAMTLLLALLSKETAIAVSAIIFLLSRHYRQRLIWLFWHLGAVGFYFILRFLVLGQYTFKAKVEFVFNPLAYVSFFERFSTALKILVLYIWKIFVPLRLSADYSYDQIPMVKNLFFSPLSLIGFVFLCLMLWRIYRILRIRKGVILDWALLFFFLPFLVVSNIIFPTGTIMAERLMYFPSLGAIMILALALERLYRFSKNYGLIVLSVLMVVYGFLTFSQNRVWASREAFLTDMFEKSPDSVVAKTEYGILVLNKDKELAKQLSLEVYEKYPDYIQNLNLRAAVEVQGGNLNEAEKFLKRALELRPKHQNTLQNLSRVYFTLSKYQEAEKTLKVLVSEYGGKGNVIFYALVQAKMGSFDEARRTLYSFFGSEVNDESAFKILRGEFKELEGFYIF